MRLDWRSWDRNPGHKPDWAEGPQQDNDSKHTGESEGQLCGGPGVDQPEPGPKCQTILKTTTDIPRRLEPSAEH